MFKKISMLSLLLCSVSTMSFADTLSDVLSYTYENNLTINAERSNLRATDEGVAKAKSGYRPSLVAQGSVGRAYNRLNYYNLLLDSKEETYQNPNDASLVLTQPVFSGLSTVNTVEAAKQQVKSGRSNLLNTEQAVLLDATTVYMDVIRDTAVLELQKNNEKVLRQHLDSYRKRFKAGELTRTDVSQAEARLAGATANRIAAEGDLQVSKANFFSVIGIEPVGLQDVIDIQAPLPTTLQDAIDEALQKNPKIKAAEYARDAAMSQVKAKKGALAPVVTVGAATGYQRENVSIKEDDYWQVTANVTVPLFQSGMEYAEVREAKQLANRYKILWSKMTQDVRAETISAWERYNATKAQISSIKAQIKASGIALSGVIREANVGSRTGLDVLDAEQEHLDNQVSLIKAHREEIVSAFSLLSAVGRMNPTDLGLPVAPYDPKSYYEEVKNQWFGYSIED